MATVSLPSKGGEKEFGRYVRDGVHPSPEGYAKFVTPTILAATSLEAKSAAKP